ncbi:hypothetical protein ODZ84_19000 [Chryseobacterium fluminis]|uniref:hypothetical protein n=1 Tax=Chryseobacterium fluminis TaxID=2983606 RepID=UPI0022548BB8|nr:hypothetical protein [Chryseobacterium sp. MMS21-Ot14]UZT97255.1 hypothetical protein ODZ84_19000 [Chryseobacterium sp. MMS21-Ot14]
MEIKSKRRSQIKILIITMLFSTALLKSQITINYDIKKIPETRNYRIYISIKNNTDKKYVIPIDTTGFRVYYPDEPVSEFYYEQADRGLGLILLFKDVDKYVTGESRSHAFRETDIDDHMSKEYKQKQNTYKKEIDRWRKKYKIKDEDAAKKNKYLYNSLKILNPGEILSFYKTFDFLDFNDNKDYYNLYPLEYDKKYNFSLEYSVDKEIYSNLTSEQKEIFKDYIFLYGRQTSDISQFEVSEEEYKRN